MQPSQDEFIESFYRENFEALVVYAYRFLGDWDDAQSAVQEAFRICLKKIGDFYKSPNQIGWIRNTVKNTARNMIRVRNHQIRLVVALQSALPDPSEARNDDGGQDVLDRCAQVVSPEDISLLKRVALDGVSYVEMAKELGISMWACRKRVQRITRKIREKLDRSDFS